MTVEIPITGAVKTSPRDEVFMFKFALRSLVLLVCSMGVSIPFFTYACVSDYHVATKKVPHHISANQMKTLKTFLAEERIAEGWNYLAFLGDDYGEMAKFVVGGSAGFTGALSYGLIRSHWSLTEGLNAYESSFKKVAVKHFGQYLEILQTGYWPDSDQILLSYITALKSQNLGESTAFDVVWQSSVLESLSSWQELVNLRKERSIYDSNICSKLDDSNNSLTVIGDFLVVLPQSVYLSVRSLFGAAQ